MKQSSEFAGNFCTSQTKSSRVAVFNLLQNSKYQDIQILLDAFPHIVWMADCTGELIFLNQPWARLTGLSIAQSLGSQFFQYIDVSDRDRVWQQWQRSLQTQQPFSTTAQIRQASGCNGLFLLQANPVQPETNTGVAWMGTLTPTEDPQIKLRREKEQELQAIVIRNMAEGVCLVRLSDGIIVYTNPKFEQMFGYEPGELQGQHVAVVNYATDLTQAQAIAQNICQQASQSGGISYEVHNIKKDGTPFWSRATASLFDHPDYGTVLVGVQQDITEQKQVEQSLQHSEQRFQAIFDQTFQFMGLLEPDGTLIEANQAALDFGGLKPTDVIGLPFWETHWWQHSAVVQAQLRNAIAHTAQGAVIRYEVDVVGVSGAIASLDFSLKPIKDETGQIISLIAEGRDISSRKQAEAEIHKLNAELEARVAQRTAQLATSNQRYETLTHVSPVGIFHTDRQGKSIYANERWCEMAGLEPQNGQGKRWLDALHPSDRQRVIAEWEQTLQNNEQFLSEFRLQRPNGEELWVYGQATPETDGLGNIVGYVGTITDITALKLAEQALKDSEELFRGMFEQAAVGFAQLTLDGRWLRVNQKLCDILGYSREELMEKTFQAITHPEDLELDLGYANRLLVGDIPGYSLEKRYIRKDGSFVWVNLTASLIYASATGLPKYFVGVVEDITERRQAEAERKLAEQALQERAIELIQLNALLARTASKLEERNQELDQFAYIASHDLKAPLRAIANLSEWLEDDLRGQLPEENQHQMQLLRGRVHRMEALINGLLQYSRVGRTEAHIETFAVQDLLLEVIDSLDPPSTIAIDIQPDLPTLTARGLLLRQVFANLISNAIKHRDRPTGHITLAAQDQGLVYEFRVADDGPGIAPENHDRIFLIFQTLEARDQTENTGVGLSIVKKIVETEGGSIRVESQVGQGTTFRFTWPKQLK